MPGTKTTFAKKHPTLTFDYLLLEPWCFLPAVSRVFPYAVNSFIGSFIDPCKRLYNSNIFQPNTQKQHITKFDSPPFPGVQTIETRIFASLPVRIPDFETTQRRLGRGVHKPYLCPDLRVTDGGNFIDPFGL